MSCVMPVFDNALLSLRRPAGRARLESLSITGGSPTSHRDLSKMTARRSVPNSSFDVLVLVVGNVNKIDF